MSYPESKSSGEMESTKWKPYHFVMNNGQAILMEDCMFTDWRIAAEKTTKLILDWMGK